MAIAALSTGSEHELRGMVDSAAALLSQAAGRSLTAQERSAFDRAHEFLKENPGLIQSAEELLRFVDSNLDRDPQLFFATDRLLAEASFPSPVIGADLIDTGGHRSNAGRAAVIASLQYDGRVREDRDDAAALFGSRDPIELALKDEPGVRFRRSELSLSFLENGDRRPVRRAS